jgi:hypothetical protein
VHDPIRIRHEDEKNRFRYLDENSANAQVEASLSATEIEVRHFDGWYGNVGSARFKSNG